MNYHRICFVLLVMTDTSKDQFRCIQYIRLQQGGTFGSPVNTFIHPDDREITAQKHNTLRKGEPLLNFENRYIAKTGEIIWLSWTFVPIIRDKLVFAIAKNITYKKQIEEFDRISLILAMINDDHKQRFKTGQNNVNAKALIIPKLKVNAKVNHEPSPLDQQWLSNFESTVRKYVGRLDLTLHMISDELALSERQLYRRVDRILGITPNKLVRIIRLQLAWEAIASGKYRTVAEISSLAGFKSRAHFSKLFKEVYGIDATELM
ncbi:helix-turn-helix domain-containing protein [Mucilaginibacter antarcticus]|uniref:helix-turn-helix domain-containing protein n=1 Tax=Mucilaginibacter antarcticus TaxID=1855725 RepID=UPI00362E5543